MAKKDTVSRELVAEVMKRILFQIETPIYEESPIPLPEVDTELKDIDAFINRLMIAASPASVPGYVAPLAESACGTRPVSLRIPNRVINAFRAESMKTGTSYQTLMIRALADATEEFAL